MNKQNFKNDNQSYPISTDTLDFMQDTDNLISKLAAVNGSNYIITQSSAVTDGVIVLANEVMPLKGNPAAFIEIVEESKDITIVDTTYTAARTLRYATYKSSSATGIKRNQVPILNRTGVIAKGIKTINGPFIGSYHNFNIVFTTQTLDLKYLCFAQATSINSLGIDYNPLFLEVVKKNSNNIDMRAWKLQNAFPTSFEVDYLITTY